ncbi:MAG TPA: hypothetical protein VEO54_04305 [Thermoanaerobaculia bacterium]|nr:hypothetical protein [Thermoanaerobaculia bacterium]
MRRIIFAAVLFAFVASCGYRPVFIDRPVIQPSIGSVAPRIAQIKGHQGTACREIGRSRCDLQTCKGRGLDLVTVSCGGAKVSRCELGKGGC